METEIIENKNNSYSDFSNSSKTLIYIILGIVLLETLAQSCLKKTKLTNNQNYMYISVISYFLICLLLIKSYSYDTMGVVNLIWSCFSIILVILSGVCLYHEELTKYDCTGIVFVFIGLYFIFMKDHKNKM